MHRRLSSLVISKNPRGSTSFDVGDDGSDNESKASTIVREELLPVPSLKVKRVDYYYSRWGKSWKYRNMSSKVTVETLPVMSGGGTSDIWKDFCFVIIRKVPRSEIIEPTFKIVVKSEYLLKACKDVIQTWPGISWNTDPLELDPEMFLTFLQRFIDYRDALVSKKGKSEQETHVLSCVNILLSTVSTDYRGTIASINKLTSHNEITFDLLYALLVPRSIFVARCAITGLPRLFKLESFTRTLVDARSVYQLICESVDLVDRPVSHTVGVGKVQTTILLRYFKGTAKIDSLDAFPIQYHADEAKLRQSIIKRGNKWVSLIGVHHMQYQGLAALKCGEKLIKHNVKSRIMLDRTTFRRLNPSYQFATPVPPKAITDPHAPLQPPHPDPFGLPPTPVIPIAGGYANGTLVESHKEDDTADIEMTEEELLLTPAVVHGFSLTDKVWLEFNVEKIEDVDWNQDAFANLVLPSSRKDLLQSLVEAHHKELGFDDFIKGKGHGLVINLFGPPGVGKTFSAEATSEHVKRPLYVIGGGDLGTSAAALDAALERVFDVATAWKAIVLIDEADVFLEQRSLHDLERNAMVAVFLRHVEYYRGILFLTTNRVQVFDEAFLSRIHVALHFQQLSQSSKEQVWAAFIAKVGASNNITAEQIKDLATRNVNGRQIKNAARTAHSLAVGRGEKVGFGHFAETLDALDEFAQEFKGLNQ